MNSGWIKIHRKMLEWEWYDDAKTLKFFLHLILTCNYKERRWRGIKLKAGETIKSLITLAEESNLSVRSVRTAIKRLKSTGEVTQRYHGRKRILKLESYAKYQVGDTASDTKTTHKRHINDTKTTLDKEGKERKKEKNVKNKMCKKDFEEFWELYPVKKNKKKAEEKFRLLDKGLLSAILAAIKNQGKSDEWINGFIPHPTTWLNGARWEDEGAAREAPEVREEDFLKIALAHKPSKHD